MYNVHFSKCSTLILRKGYRFFFRIYVEVEFLKHSFGKKQYLERQKEVL